ncbi:Spx/MgsR family RNA polymerase-binding regulatory protein [Macrococcus equipercicus]|uniref:Spx/MgsR family RNA polymerase-binding regulatory protein n=1 Tax=Macrococcus equipercicus TaxID=69967 RepID=A0A9Q9BW50_9STAP|nr:Spx/MgsR family RNA polymerase-binding regulatory protein [Macrococcus equipercicus]KAA1042511.1 Spx/MgsR family RNA polymerase-binding regulatory protein [Macrococcus equipercicus]UTH14372.1 Spx/MgsR family RNA polymerase-binding regulatory protein [Macrococcus equipercicus]
MIKFFQIPNCSTCKKAAQFLTDNGVSYEPINLKEHTPTTGEFTQIIQQTGVDIDKLFNRQGTKFRELNLKDRLAHLSHAEKLDLLASDGMLVKRPLAVNDGKITLGFKEADYRDTWL